MSSDSGGLDVADEPIATRVCVAFNVAQDQALSQFALDLVRKHTAPRMKEEPTDDAEGDTNNVAADNVPQAARHRLAETPTAGTNRRDTIMGPMQTRVLADILRTCRCMEQLDPALSEGDPMQGAAVRKYGIRMCWCQIQQLQPWHSDVQQTFLHGHHRGQRVETLTQQLLDEDRRRSARLLHDITPLVAARYCGMLVVVFGNRRLKALQDYALQRRSKEGESPKVRVIVHDFPFHYMEPEPMQAFSAKFVLAFTNYGAPVSFRRQRHW